MKILYVTQYYSSKPTHASTVTTYEIVERLTKRGHEMIVVSADSPGIARIFKKNASGSRIVKALPFPSLSTQWYNGFSTFFTHTVVHALVFINVLVANHRCKNFDAIISMYHPSHMATVSAYLLSRVLKLPLVVKIHDFTIEAAEPKRLRRMYKIVLGQVNKRFVKKCSAILVQGPELKDIIKEQSEVDAAKLIIFPNGVDSSLFKPGLESESLRKELGLKGRKIILFLGGMYRQRHPELLVKALPDVVKEIKNVRVLFLGEGPEKPKLSSLADRLGVRDFVEFKSGVAHPLVPMFVSLADVAIGPLCVTSHPIIYGSIPLTVLEYMACGKPVIVCRGAVSESLVVDGRNGWAVSPGDVQGLSSAIVQLIEDENLSKKMGLDAREYVEENYDWDILINRLEKVLSSLVYRVY